MLRLLLYTIANIFLLANCYLIKDSKETYLHDKNAGEPLFLTPYIDNGNLEEARNLSRVEFPGFPELKSYSGFFTVDSTYSSNQFFWYFPPKNNVKNEVVILWLQGGPGSSSLFGLFTENGPIEVQNGIFKERETHWALEHHVLYIDNPVGAGFSFTNDSRGYCTDQTQVGDHLYNSLTQFFKLFPELQPLTFIITGESYAGKYIPALGYTIHMRNPSAKIKINLKGLAIGNGLCDPINQLNYGEYLYEIGLIDWNQLDVLKNQQTELIKCIKNEQWLWAYGKWTELMNHILLFRGNGISIYNFLQANAEKSYLGLIETDSVRKAIHVGNLSYSSVDENVRLNLSEDVMQSVAPWISELLSHYPVLIYSGQLDIIVAYTLTTNFLRNLNFSGSEEYKTAEREIWSWLNPKTNVEEQIGYKKRAGNLTEVMIRNAGHMVPTDQPEWALEVLTSWILSIENNN